MIVATRAEPGVLHATSSGAFSLPEAESRFMRVLEFAAGLDFIKILIDGRQIEGDPTESIDEARPWLSDAARSSQ